MRLWHPKYDVGRATEAIAEGLAIKLGTNDGNYDLVDATTDIVHGFAVNATTKAGEDIEFYREGGDAVGVSGGTITRGARLSVNASGKLVANSTDNDPVIGYAYDAASAADQKVRFNFTRHSV